MTRKVSTKPPAKRAETGPIVGAAGLRRKLAERQEGVVGYLLKLYVTGATPASRRAIQRVRDLCQKHLSGRYQLDVIDLYQCPTMAREAQIVATPTLVQVRPEPLRRFIGDLSRLENVLFGAS